MPKNIHTIDATGKSLGRLASEIAILLMGKNKATYTRNKDEGDLVVIKNINLVKITGKKMEQKTYKRHTNYQGHLKIRPLSLVFKKDPKEVLKRTVFSMLPETKQRRAMMARLRFE